MDDEQIISLYWQRSEAAIGATAEKYGRYCHTIAYNILHNREDAEECVNDTYWGAWTSIPPQRPRRLMAYLGRITRNLSLNRYQCYTAEKRGQGQTALALSELAECIPAAGDVEDHWNEMALVRAIEGFLRSQPTEKRNIFIRRYWYLIPLREIAQSYQMREQKVASLLFRMRKQLKTHLERECITL